MIVLLLAQQRRLEGTHSSPSSVNSSAAAANLAICSDIGRDALICRPCHGNISRYRDCLMGRGKRETDRSPALHTRVGTAVSQFFALLDFACNTSTGPSWLSRTATTRPCRPGLSPRTTTLTSAYPIPPTPWTTRKTACVGRIILLRPCIRATPRTLPVTVRTAADRRIIRAYMARVHSHPLRSRYKVFPLLLWRRRQGRN